MMDKLALGQVFSDDQVDPSACYHLLPISFEELKYKL
jgi:hypothetical protein